MRLRRELPTARAPWLRGWAKDSTLVLASQVSGLLVTTALTVLIARQLGPASFGLLAAFQGTAQIAMVFVDAGIATFLLRELSRLWAGGHSEEALRTTETLVGACYALTTVAALVLVGSAFVFGVIALGSYTLAGALAAIVGYTAVIVGADSLEVVYRARRRLRFLAVAIVFEKALLGVFVGSVLLLHGGLLPIGIAYVCAALIRVTYDHVVVRVLGVRPRRPSALDIGNALRSAIPFGLGVSAPSAVVRFDATLIGLFSTTAAGLYAIGDRVLTALFVVSSTAATTLYPVLAQETARRRLTIRAAAIMFALGAVVASVTIALVPDFVPVLFGSRYRSAVSAVQIMLVATPLVYTVSVLMTGMFVAHRDRVVIRVMLAGTVFGSALVVLGQWLFGVEGAAGGYALRFLFVFVVMAAAMRRRPGTGPDSAKIARPSKVGLASEGNR